MNESLKKKLEFLTSSRFWAMVIAAFSIYAKTKGWIGDAEMILISSIMGGFTVVRTVDRIGDKRVEAASKSTAVAPVDEQ